MFRSSLLVLLFAASPLLAQERVAVLGDRVRIMAPGAGYRQVTGNVIGTTPDVINISLDRVATEIAVPRDSIRRLLLSVGRKRHVARGVAVGTVLGAGFALWFGPKESQIPGSTIESGRGSTKNLITGSLVGAGMGAIVGYYGRTDSWVQITPRSR